VIAKVRKFIFEVVGELKKVSWSTKQELFEATWIVILSSIILGTFIGVFDFALSKALGLLLR